MHRSIVLTGFLVCAFLVGSGCSGIETKGVTDPLVKILTHQLDVTANQAKGGLGSTLTLAKEKLTAPDFETLTKYVPGTETYMKAAKDLGAVTGPINDRAGLEAAYSKLGMSWDKVGKFSKVLSDFVGSAGGEQAQGFLTSMMK
ncbi:MAG: DUF2780 domain-containing protein [Nitrospira sp.]|nr:DUF2780 domain-containing protein [Nitrospira sp.]